MGRTIGWGVVLVVLLGVACGGKTELDDGGPSCGPLAAGDDWSTDRGAGGGAGAELEGGAGAEPDGETDERLTPDRLDLLGTFRPSLPLSDAFDSAPLAPTEGVTRTGAATPESGSSVSALPHCEGSCSGCSSELGVCYIQCIGDYTCTQADLICPEGWPCEVICAGRHACSQADVRCPPGYRCSLECSGSSSCTQLDLYCEGYLCEVGCSGSFSCTQLRRSPNP